MDMLREPTKGKVLKVSHFPTEYQTLIFRLWEMVDYRKIAKVIETSEENVLKAAQDMGLGAQKYLSEWMSRGYISILRAVWNLLPYEQIYKLLDWDRERLSFVLKEDDFLGHKLGEKCDCPPVLFRPLSEEERKATARIKETMEKEVLPLMREETAVPFDFFQSKYQPIVESRRREVVVDSGWCIELPEESSGIDDYVADFKAFAAKYGVTFCERSEKKIRIQMDVANRAGEEASVAGGTGDGIVTQDEEYHEINVKEDLITINAVYPAGVLRALYDLEDLAENAGSFTFDKKSYKKRTKVKTRFIYSFCGLYNDVLDRDTRISFPDELLEGYARRGINGVWIQGVLYKIAPYPFDEKLSEGWEERLANLEALTHRAARYGIKVYVYINEPRNMPFSFFEKYPHLKGASLGRGEGVACLCSSHPEVHKYLKDALQTVCRRVPLLGGFFNITQSENRATCWSRGYKATKEEECPVCSKRKPAVVTSEILKTMADAVAEVDPKIKFFAFAWTWMHDLGEEVFELVDLLPKNVIVLQVSESKMKFVRSGIVGEVRDYALSIVGPGEQAKALWDASKKHGLEVAAKVQINNSWECSTAPFLPVYDNVIQHMKNLIDEGIEHMMLSWTLGGYFSDNLKIASSYFFEDECNQEDVYDEVLTRNYGSYAEQVKQAVNHFCKGFGEYPFNIYHVYRGPSNAGVANLLYPEPSGMRSTTTCYSYDDVKGWCAAWPGDDIEGWPELYTGEVLEAQYDKLCKEWEKGLAILEGMPVCEFYDMAVYGYTLFKSSYNQTAYYLLRDGERDEEKMRKLVESEKELALKAYEIMLRNSSVGYEAANHYYVTRSMLMEKIVQCDYLLA